VHHVLPDIISVVGLVWKIRHQRGKQTKSLCDLTLKFKYQFRGATTSLRRWMLLHKSRKMLQRI